MGACTRCLIFAYECRVGDSFGANLVVRHRGANAPNPHVAVSVVGSANFAQNKITFRVFTVVNFLAVPIFALLLGAIIEPT